MNLQLWIPVFVLIVGLLVWFFAAPPKIQEIGRIFFMTGFLVFLLSIAGHVLHISG